MCVCGRAAIPGIEITGMGMPIDKLQSLAQCRIQTVYLSHGTVVDRIGWDDVDLIGIVFDAVEDSFSKRTIITAKLIVPTAGVILGTEDRGGFFPPSVQQFQDVMLFRLCRFQQEPFINDEKDGVGILSLNLLVSAIATSYIKLEEHIRQANVLCPIALFTGFHAKCTGHVSLTASGGPCNEKVPMLGDILADCQSFNQAAV